VNIQRRDRWLSVPDQPRVSTASDSNVRAPAAGHRIVPANHRSEPLKSEAAKAIATTDKLTRILQ
jgi:hypothetical protein